MATRVMVEFVGGRFDGFQCELDDRLVSLPLVVSTRSGAGTDEDTLYVRSSRPDRDGRLIFEQRPWVDPGDWHARVFTD